MGKRNTIIRIRYSAIVPIKILQECISEVVINIQKISAQFGNLLLVTVEYFIIVLGQIECRRFRSTSADYFLQRHNAE